MPISMIGVVHVLTAVIGLLAGVLSMTFRKGSGLHGAAGTVFFVCMLTMSATGAWHSAFVRPLPSNVVGGMLTFYLVGTSWRAARQRRGTGALERAALVLALGIGAFAFVHGFRVAAGGRSEMPAPFFFVFGTIALLCAAADLRWIRRGGTTGPARIVRHLWRMCLGFLIGLLSLYPGQAQLFPGWLRETNLLFVPHLLIFGSMLFWLARMSRRKRGDREAPHPTSPTSPTVPPLFRPRAG